MLRRGLFSALFCVWSVNAQVILLDTPDEGTGESLVVATNAHSVCASTAHEESFLHNAGVSPAGKLVAKYSFMPPRDGCYLVEEYHPELTSECTNGLPAGKVPLRIDFCKGKVAMGVIDQSKRGGQWNKLTKLPFYVGDKGSVSITREDFPESVCPDDKCFYAADAFRFTYVAPTCQETKDSKDSTTSTAQEKTEQAETKATQGQGAASKASSAAVSAEAKVGDAEMFVQAVVDDAAVKGKFVFQPPRDGCYIVEARHPHVDGLSAAPLTVNYCKGKKIVVPLDHTNGRHSQWNYVATLPFFEDVEASAVLAPKHVRAEHAFRFTHLPGGCQSDSSQVHSMQLRLTTDFANVADRLPSFKADLGAELARQAGVPAQRLMVAHAREGSVIAEVVVRPAAFDVAGTPSNALSAKELTALIQEKVESETWTYDPKLGRSTSLSKELCLLAGASNDGTCTAEVLSTGIARPLPEMEMASAKASTSRDAGMPQKEETDMLVLALGLVAMSLVLGAATILGCKLYKKRQALAGQDAAKVAEPANAEIIQVSGAPMNEEPQKESQKENDVIDDNASTATPGSDRSKEELDVEPTAQAMN